jgi:mRNA-degrading endonuclease toxin of MazEF toxin-antitoxin module
MMEKDFKKWNKQKQNIHENKERPFFNDAEVWFAKLGENIGYEQDGRGEDFLRPGLVLKKFNSSLLWIIPLTKTQKVGKYYFSFSFSKNIVSVAILSQLRVIDSKRLEYRVGKMKTLEYVELTKKLKEIFP